jgi:hypothetical protein
MYYDKYKNFKNLYVELKPMSSALVLGLIIISLGFYIINWIYLRNKDFEKLDKFAPDSNRGAMVMFVIPMLWYLIDLSFKKMIFRNSDLYLVISGIIWFFVLFLILKYLYDFTYSFGRITRTWPSVWFIPFAIGLGSFYLGNILDKPIISLGIIILAILVPAMQEELNTTIKKFEIKKNLKIWYG